MPNQRQNHLQKNHYMLPVILVITATLALLSFMYLFKPSEQEKVDDVVIPTVEVVNIQPLDYTIVIQSDGVVKPQTSINFAAEITGKVIAIAKNFSNGGEFSQGDVLVEVDPKDYQLAITKAQANVTSATAKLDLEQAKADLAATDWKKYGKSGKPSALNLNLPQVASAKAALDGAVADLQLAQRNLEKTKIIAPFDGVILSKSVDVGQFVNTGTSLATIASTTMAELRISLSDQQLVEGGLNNSSQDIPVSIFSEEIPGVQWVGKVKHIEAQRDVRTLMNYVVIEVLQPFKQQPVPLRFNSFVTVEFSGKKLLNVYPIQRQYMLLNNRVKLLDAEMKLSIQALTVIYADDDKFYVAEGISANDRLITTQLPNVKAGSQLRLADSALDSTHINPDDGH